MNRRLGQQRQAGRFTLPILAYHSVCNGPATALCVPTGPFLEQMRHLKQAGYQTISFVDLMRWELGFATMPSKPVILTFDDGYADNYTNLYPILQRERLQATIFLIARSVGTPGYLDWAQILEMQAHGVEFGAHTLTHRNVTEISSEEKRQEITGSKQELEQHLTRPVVAFAYPYGIYDAESEEIVRESGYLFAVSGDEGYAAPVEETFHMKRVVINGYMTLDQLKKQLL